MQYRYYILRFFLAFTLALGACGAWGQQTKSINAEQFPVSLTSTAFKDVSSKIKSIVKYRYIRSYATLNGGHLWYGVAEIVNTNDKPSAYFFYIDVDQFLQIQGAGALEVKSDQYSGNYNLSRVEVNDIAKTYYGFAVSIKIPTVVRLSEISANTNFTHYGECSPLLNEYFNSEYTRTQAEISKPENSNVKSAFENTWYGGTFLVKINGNTNRPMGLIKAPFSNLEATLKGVGGLDAEYFIQNPNQMNDPTAIVFYSKNILYESLGYAKARENEFLNGRNPDNLKYYFSLYKNFAYNESKQDIVIPSEYVNDGIIDINNIKGINRLKDDTYLIRGRSRNYVVNFSTGVFSSIDLTKLDISPINPLNKSYFFETTEGQYISLYTSYSDEYTTTKFSKTGIINLKKNYGKTSLGKGLSSGFKINENSYGILFPYYNSNSDFGISFLELDKGFNSTIIYKLISPSSLEAFRYFSEPFPENATKIDDVTPFCVLNEKDILFTNYPIFTDKNDLSKLSFLYYKLGSTNVEPTTLTPAFSFTPAAPKVNQAVTFKDESTGSPTSWAWDLGDGTTSTLQNPTKTYNKAGNYTVKLTISKQGATAASTTKSITITAEAATLALSTITHNAPVAGEQGGLNISTNTNWTANSNAAWLKVSPTSGNAGTNVAINYTVDANNATAARTGIITFTAGTQTATFTVTQAGVAPSLSVSPTAPATIAAAGSTVALSVVSNLSWSVAKSANSDWLTVSPTSGTGNQNVSATASANATTAERSSTLTFSAAGVANVVVTIRQAGVNASLSLSETSIKVNASPISIGILKLTTNTAWTVKSDAEWLTVGPTSGNAGTNIELTWSVAINTTPNSRTGKITVMAGTQTSTFTVTQAGINPEFSLSAESKAVAATGESGQLGITSNVPWSATSNATWLTFSPASGGIGVINNFRYGVEANPNTTTRTGVITFSASGLTKAFTVTQEGTKPTHPQAPTQLTVTAVSEYELRISWKDNASNETSYELERADGLLLGPTNSDFKKIVTLPANTTTFLDQKLTSKSQYCYRVRAVNAVGASEFMQSVCGTTNAPSAGITLITHGFSPAGPEAPSIIPLKNDFTANFGKFANSIKEKADAGATVYINDVNTGKWKRWEAVSNNGNGDPTKEIILFYNWADASNTELYALLNNLPYLSNSGYLEGSADILFAMLADAQIPNLPNNLLTSGKPLHFIAHSRGNLLFLQLMHRMAKWFPTVKIDHYTALDPHPATNMGDVVRNQKNTYASLPLVSGEASGCTATIGCSSASTGDKEIKIRIPENVVKAEVYYRKDGDYEDANTNLQTLYNAVKAGSVSPFLLLTYKRENLKLLVAFDGVPSIGGVNNQLDNDKISEGKTGGFGGAHSGVVSWYFGTIDTRLTTDDGKPISFDGEPLYLNQWYGTNGALLATKPAREKSGFYFSRIGGGYAQLADATNKVSLTTMDSQLAERPRLNNTDGGMKLGIQNGNFEYYNDSGWRFGGGTNSMLTDFKDGKCQGKKVSDIPQTFEIAHSLMYFPSSFNYLQVHSLKDTKAIISQKITVQFLNRDLTAIGQAIEVVPTKNDTKAYIKIPASLKGKSGSFTIKATGVLLEKVEFSDRIGSQDVIIESLAQPETPQTVEALYEIFPNPNNGRFSLTSQDAQMPAIAVVVVDVIGNVLFKATDNQLSVFNSQQKLDIALPGGFTGSYTLRVETAQGVSFKRIIKE